MKLPDSKGPRMRQDETLSKGIMAGEGEKLSGTQAYTEKFYVEEKEASGTLPRSRT